MVVLNSVLTIYAAFLSTAVFVWNVQRSISKVRSRLIWAAGDFDGRPNQGVMISVQNASSGTVQVRSVSLLHKLQKSTWRAYLSHLIRYRRHSPSAGWIHRGFEGLNADPRVPVTLEPGDSHEIFLADDVVSSVLVGSPTKELRVVVQDALWRNSYSNVLDYSDG